MRIIIARISLAENSGNHHHRHGPCYAPCRRHDFLLKGDVFSKDQIESYIELKMEDVARWEMTPSPVEFDMYYSS